MIYEISSSLPSFKKLILKAGMNILVADKTADSSDRHSRNGAGKSSLVDIVRFLLGGSAEKDSIFRGQALASHSFRMEFDLSGGRAEVRRSGQSANKVFVSATPDRCWPDSVVSQITTVDSEISVADWKRVLTHCMFDMDDLDSDSSEHEDAYRPSSGSLVPYYVRRQRDGGFDSPVKHTNMQQPHDSQAALMLLLGLDWTIASQWKAVRDKEKNLKSLKRAVTAGAFSDLVGTTAELRTELAVSEQAAESLRRSINDFNLLPQYRELEAEADHVTSLISLLTDHNLIDRQILIELQNSLDQEFLPSVPDLRRLYSEAGVVLANHVLRRFEDVRAFHESVVANRREHFSLEIAKVSRRLDERDAEIASLSARQSQIMSILRASGALDQLQRLQSELASIVAKIDQLRFRFEAAERLESGKTELEVERGNLLLRLQQEFRDRQSAVGHAIVVFQEVSNSLYEQAGSLKLSESLNGPQFELSIPNAKSKGISNMQVFCFDMMIMRLSSERGLGPGFLIHDSHLFDGVDERQIARALVLGSRYAAELGFQYIVTMNTDDIPTEFPEEFDVDRYLVPVTLTDATVDGGLFGIRF
ncbi:MAG: DUF2326 domain-containing protein [Thermomicrobiales bacterium]|nr:DUF2326 domain-containing protein [Thermomicrobiales bacterium]